MARLLLEMRHSHSLDLGPGSSCTKGLRPRIRILPESDFCNFLLFVLNPYNKTISIYFVTKFLKSSKQ